MSAFFFLFRVPIPFLQSRERRGEVLPSLLDSRGIEKVARTERFMDETDENAGLGEGEVAIPAFGNRCSIDLPLPPEL
jgi:hypothetical protein